MTSDVKRFKKEIHVGKKITFAIRVDFSGGLAEGIPQDFFT
jgi:hypothetical protein